MIRSVLSPGDTEADCNVHDAVSLCGAVRPGRPRRRSLRPTSGDQKTSVQVPGSSTGHPIAFSAFRTLHES